LRVSNANPGTLVEVVIPLTPQPPKGQALLTSVDGKQAEASTLFVRPQSGNPITGTIC
jgi:hypothetical protein